MALSAGDHRPIAVAVTPGGEVWTWGLMLGDPLTLAHRLQSQAIKLAKHFGYKGPVGIEPGHPPHAVAAAARRTGRSIEIAALAGELLRRFPWK